MTRIAKQEDLPRVGMTRIGKQGVMARVGRTRIVMHGRLPRGKSALDRELANILISKKIEQISAQMPSLTLEEAHTFVDYRQDKIGVASSAFAPSVVIANKYCQYCYC
ncbi:hypothetical protein LWI29_036288 [Acer saccharum]|uniref:Uncharacterized protein n=1 Tax=Acer saccharum TaxID=4024 RepID=A0AA39W9K6_ACESA|nr:hypothetical protein LWI29_036288 [Acer saccharum]